MALANDGDRAIEYYGYQPVNQSGHLDNGYIAPCCDSEVPDGNAWRRPYAWRCRSGAQNLVVQPGQAAYFEEHQQGENPIFRVTLDYHDPGDKHGTTKRTVVSGAIDAGASESVYQVDVKPIHHRTGPVLAWLRRVFG
jgi:hypothetical protein